MGNSGKCQTQNSHWQFAGGTAEIFLDMHYFFMCFDDVGPVFLKNISFMQCCEDGFPP